MNAPKEILICVKTYPEYSAKYTETVCTAGILKESRKIIRLYPVMYRYLTGNQRFRKYQWITAQIEKSAQDDRLEKLQTSYRIYFFRTPNRKFSQLEREKTMGFV